MLAIAGALWLGWSRGGLTLNAFVDPSSWWLDLGLGLAAAGVLLGLWDLGRRSVAALRRLEAIFGEMLGGLTADEALVLGVISGFAEELFFRGAMQSSWGWAWTLVLFTLLHWGGRGMTWRWWTLFAGVAGLLFGALVAWRGNILPAVVGHIVVNAVNLRRLGRRRAATHVDA